jgi:glycosyltransferase involved in cell wall biosynthesis
MSADSPISFIIPAFNCAGTLSAAVQSIYAGNLGAGDEIVVVNDGSTDETQAVIDDLAARHPEVRWFRHRHNKGSAAAGRNTGIDQARSELLFCLDADNVLAPNSLPRLKQFLLERKADAASFQEFLFFQSDIGEITHRWRCKEGTVTLGDALCTDVWPGPDGNYLFTRASWLKAGRYHESVGGAIDSWAFGVAQLATGSRLLVLPGSFYYHRWGHASACVRARDEATRSLKALQVLLPHLDLLLDEDVEYLFSKQGRETWYGNLPRRPLRIKGQEHGEGGHVLWTRPRKRGLVERVRHRLARMIAPCSG